MLATAVALKSPGSSPSARSQGVLMSAAKIRDDLLQIDRQVHRLFANRGDARSGPQCIGTARGKNCPELFRRIGRTGAKPAVSPGPKITEDPPLPLI
jgi:hypothetical protein